MTAGQKIKHRKNMKALNRAKGNKPVWEKDGKGNMKPVGFVTVTDFKSIRL